MELIKYEEYKNEKAIEIEKNGKGEIKISIITFNSLNGNKNDPIISIITPKIIKETELNMQNSIVEIQNQIEKHEANIKMLNESIRNLNIFKEDIKNIKDVSDFDSEAIINNSIPINNRITKEDKKWYFIKIFLE